MYKLILFNLIYINLILPHFSFKYKFNLLHKYIIQNFSNHKIISERKKKEFDNRLKMFRTYDFNQLKKENESIGKRLIKKYLNSFLI